MPSVSLCMIVRNEEASLPKCLASVAPFPDEIILVDTGSTDNTKAIAAQYTSLIYDFPWIDDFSAARNFAFSKASMDYCFWLDADDVLPSESLALLLQKKNSLSADVVMLPYQIAFDAQNRPAFSFFRERLLRRSMGFQWEGAVHEVITPRGNIEHWDAPIQHISSGNAHSDRNLRIYQNRLAQGIPFSPRDQYYYARELMDHAAYQAAIAAFSQFLTEGKGWYVDNISACLCSSECCMALHQPENALMYLLRSFQYDVPTPEGCYRMGQYFQQKGNYETAVYWYHSAIACGKLPQKGFVQEAYREYLPVVQLCFCYLKLQKPEEAEHWISYWNTIRPNDSALPPYQTECERQKQARLSF